MARRTIRDIRAVVTGATGGIGAALAERLAAEGAQLLCTGRQVDRLERLAARLTASGTRVATAAGDLTDPAFRDRLDALVAERLGGLDLLVNNAGVGAWGPFAEADESRMRRIMEVNFFAPVELTRRLLPRLVAGRRPLLVNIGSVLGHRATPYKSEYCASKFALHGWSDALRAELASQGVDLLHACPSTTRTEFFERVLVDGGRSRPEGASSRGAMTPEAVARKIVAAIRQGRHEIVLSPGGKLLVWLDRLCPALADRLIARFAPRDP